MVSVRSEHRPQALSSLITLYFQQSRQPCRLGVIVWILPVKVQTEVQTGFASHPKPHTRAGGALRRELGCSEPFARLF